MVYSYKYVFTPRHADIDKFGVVHHSKYFCWFEDARYDFFPSEYNTTIDKYGFPVTRLECKYMRSVSKIENMVIKVKLIVNYEVPIVHFKYRLMDKEERILYAKAYTEHTLLDSKGKIILSYPADIIKLWDYLIEKK